MLSAISHNYIFRLQKVASSQNWHSGRYTPIVFVLEEGPIKTLADLKGRKIGFSVAGVEEALLSGMLSPGVDLDDIELINVNFSLSPAIMSGQVDAVIGAFRNFELNQMDIEGEKGRCFFLEEEGIPAYDELIYVANPTRMNIEQIRRFIKATELATYIINNLKKLEIFQEQQKNCRMN